MCIAREQIHISHKLHAGKEIENEKYIRSQIDRFCTYRTNFSAMYWLIMFYEFSCEIPEYLVLDILGLKCDRMKIKNCLRSF